MCLAFKAKVIAVESGRIMVETAAGGKAAVVPFVEKIKKGDTVLVQQGFAIEKV